jgi:hypothetical protein
LRWRRDPSVEAAMHRIGRERFVDGLLNIERRFSS